MWTVYVKQDLLVRDGHEQGKQRPYMCKTHQSFTSKEQQVISALYQQQFTAIILLAKIHYY